MNTHNLNLIFEQYISHFAELNDVDGNDEGYKWRAESCFVEHWDIDAEDFVSMFKASTKEMSNLIDNATVQPIGGILLLLKQPNEVVLGSFIEKTAVIWRQGRIAFMRSWKR